MGAYRRPDARTLGQVLEMISPGSSAKAAPETPLAVSHSGVLVDPDGRTVGSCDCDIATAAALGCALSLIPPGGAEDMAEEAELTGPARDNLYECMNMFSALLMDDASPHLKLAQMMEGNEAPLSGDAPQVTTFELSLGRYGSGRLRFRTA